MNTTAITKWIPTTEATTIIKQLVDEGKYTKKQIKKSSYRWADPKDHAKGYLCRVMVVTTDDKAETVAATVEKKAKTKKTASSDGVPASFKKQCAEMSIDELNFLANSLELETERGWDYMSDRKRNANIRMARYADNLMKTKQAAEANA